MNCFSNVSISCSINSLTESFSKELIKIIGFLHNAQYNL